MNKATMALATLLPLAVAMPALAQASAVVLDEDGCRVSFRLKATLHSVKGSFEPVGGRIEMAADGSLEGTIVLDATSASTQHRRRDKKMHDRVLLSAQHPTIELRLREWSGELVEQGSSELTVRGTLTLLSREHELEVPVRVERQGERVTGSADLEVPYVEWGLEDPSAGPLRVAKVVRVRVELAGRLESKTSRGP